MLLTDKINMHLCDHMEQVLQYTLPTPSVPIKTIKKGELQKH